MLGKPKHLGRWLAIAVAIGLVCTSATPAAKPVKPPPPEEPVTYTLVPLSSTNGYVAAVNELDGFVELVGELYDNSQEVLVFRAYHWMVDPAGNVLPTQLQLLPPAGPGTTVAGSRALDVNNHGVVVGGQWDDAGTRTPLLWPDAASAPIGLPLPAGTTGGRACSINDAGIVLGRTYNADESANLVAWKVAVAGGEWTVQDTQTILAGAGVFSASGVPEIVNSGYAVVTLYFADVASERAYRFRLDWDDSRVWAVAGSTTQLFDALSFAYGVNEAGTVCGLRANPVPGENAIAYVLTVSGELLDLPVLPKEKIAGITYQATFNEDAVALNNAAPVQIVGEGSRSYTQGILQGGEKVPLRWDGEVRVTDVRTVTEGTPSLTSLSAINDAGWIAARTIDIYGQHALPVVLIPSR